MPESTQINTIPVEDSQADFDESYIPSSQREKTYLSQLRWLSLIHAEIAPALNARRKSAREEFQRNEDKFEPESEDKGELFLLMLHLGKYSEANKPLDFSKGK